MKRIIYFLLTMIIIGVFSTCNDCEDCNGDSPSTKVSEDEAAQVVANAFSASSGGLALQTRKASEFASEYDLTGIGKSTMKIHDEPIFDTTIVIENQQGARVTYKYTVDYQYQFVLESLVPLKGSVIAKYTVDGNYEGPVISSDDNAEANLTITGIEPSITDFTVNGTYTRNGSQTSKIGDKNSFTSLLSSTLSELKIDKTTHLITTGEGSITFSGSTTNGLAFNFNAKIVFNGKRKATLTLNGKDYTINLDTGEIS